MSEPASYLTLEAGTPVFASDGERIGAVEHVLADAGTDIFDGLVIDTRRGPGGLRFVDAPQVATIAADAVTLTLSSRAAEQLPEPSANPATMAAGAGDTVPDETLGHKLQRAWDVISGKG
jgi:uncharacterized protein YrrD